MYINMSVVVFAAFLVIRLAGADDVLPPLTYSAGVLQRPYLMFPAYDYWQMHGHIVNNDWTIRSRSVPSEVLVIPDGDGPDTIIRIVADNRLTDEAYRNVLDVWNAGGSRSTLEYVRLACLARKTETGTGYASQCVCASFNRTKTQSYDNQTEWTSAGPVSKCVVLPTFTADTFANLVNVRTLDLSGFILQDAAEDVFTGLSALQLMRITDVYMSTEVASKGLFCGRRGLNLTAIQLTNVRLFDAVDLDDTALRLFSCRSNKTDAEADEIVVTVIKVVNCNISRITENDFADIAAFDLLSIDLSGNGILTVDDAAFDRFYNLRELLLHSNRLVQLPPTVFQSLTSLRYLELAFNQLENFSTSVLPGGIVFNMLNLGWNRLRMLKGGFSVAKKLFNIRLDNNRLERVEKSTFQNCTNLLSLSLQNNRIESIDQNAFIGIKNLVILDVSNNSLWNETAIRECFWQTATQNLGQIFLKENNVTRLLPNMFSSPTENQSLYQATMRLSLSSNAIEFISSGAFRGLDQLSILHLDNNLISVLDDLVFRNLPLLTWLDLSFNRLVWLPGSIFLTNQQLENLCINDNLLMSLPQNIPEGLNLFEIANNRLTEIPSFPHKLLQLDGLNLSGNRLMSISRESLAQFPNVALLGLDNNSLTTLSDGVFANNTQLSTLSLANNQLDLDFSVDFFHHSARRFQLRLGIVILTGNRIRSARNLFRHPAMCNVLQIDLSHNPLGNFPSPDDFYCVMLHVIKLYMVNCSLTSISEDALQMAVSLQVLNLTDNRLTEFRPLSIRSPQYTVLLHGNPIVCSCRMKWLRSPHFASRYTLTDCRHAVTGQMVRFETVPLSMFLCKVHGQCLVGDAAACDCYSEDENSPKIPTHIICSNRSLSQFTTSIQQTIKIIYYDHNKLSSFGRVSSALQYANVIELHLNNNEIRQIDDEAFQSFLNLAVLDLSGNLLIRISRRTFSRMYRLEKLLLHDNHISTIEADTFFDFRALRSLILHRNELEELPGKVLDDLQSLPLLEKLTLHGNPWKCSCDNATFKNWIHNRLDVVENASEIRCDDFNETSILKLPDDNFVCFDKHRYIRDYLTGPLSAASTSTFFLMLLVVGLILAFRHRHVLQVRLYNSPFRLRLARRRENDECEYDAVIFFDADNDAVRQWVVDECLPRLLEFNRQLRLFVPDLDLSPGVDELNCIVDGVTRSRRTIVILDRGSYDNPYVLYAFKFAYHHMTTDDQTHDILLVLADSMDVDLLLQDETVDSNFNAYLTAGKRLWMNDRRFWEEANFFLPATDAREADGQNYGPDDTAMTPV